MIGLESIKYRVIPYVKKQKNRKKAIAIEKDTKTFFFIFYFIMLLNGRFVKWIFLDIDEEIQTKKYFMKVI